MPNPRTGIATLDADDKGGAHAAERLTSERIGWLTTVAPDGTPQTSPIWFLWDAEDSSILIYSLESARASNIERHARVSLNLDGNGLGGDIVVIEGTAVIDREIPQCVDNPNYLAKYEPVMDDNGWTPEWFAERYCVPVHVEITKYRYW